MAKIRPVSELRNYGKVLDDVSNGQPVYLTKNGYGVYSLWTMHDEKEYQKAMVALQLMSELNAGVRSGEEEGWIDDAYLDKHFQERRKN